MATGGLFANDIQIGVVNAYLELQDNGFFDTLNRASSAVENFETNTNNGMSALEKTSRLTGDIGTSLYRNVTVPAVQAGKSILSAFESTESAFTGVKKTLNEDDLIAEFGSLEKAYKSLDDAIWQMTQETGSSYETIAGVMEMAGQLNVPIGEAGKSIIDFTKNIIMLNDTTDLLGADAAKDLAQFMNIMNTSYDDVDNLGAAIVHLGNNSATTEAAIVAMAMRLAGAGNSIGLTEQEVLAISATLNSVGISAEMGGSAFSKAMKKMQVAAETGYEPIIDLQQETGLTLREMELMSTNNTIGFTSLADSLGMTTTELKAAIKAGNQLNDFASIANMTTEDFVKLYREDAMSAIEAFIIGLGDTESHGESTIQMLQEMGFTEVRLSDALTRMSLAQGELTRELDLANTSWSEGTALQEEADKRYGDLAVQISQLREELKSLMVDLAELFVPTIREIIGHLKNFIESLKSMPDWLQEIIVKGIAFLAILGPIFLAISKITGAVLNIIKFVDMLKGIGIVKKIGEVISSLGSGNGLLGIIQTIWGVLKSIGAALAPALQVISGLAGVIAGPIIAIKNFIDMLLEGVNFANGAFTVLGTTITGIGLFLLGLTGPIGIVVGAIVGGVLIAIAAIKEHWDEISDWFEGLWKKITEGWGRFWDGFIGSIKQSFQSVIDYITGIPKWINDNIVQPIKTALSDGFQAEDILTIGKALIDGLFEGIKIAFVYLNPLYWFWKFIVKPIIDAVKELFGIHSPSTVFAEIGQNLIEGLFQGISETWQKIVEFFSTAFNALIEWFKGTFTKIHDTIISVWGTVSTALSTVFENITGWFSDVFKYIGEWFGDLVSGISEWIKGVWETVSNFLSEVINSLREWFANILSNIIEFFGNLISNIVDNFNNLRETIHNAFESVSQVIQNIIDVIRGAFESFVEFISGVVENIKGIIEDVVSAIQGFVEIAANVIGDFFSNIFNALSELWSNLTSFISEVFGNISSFLSDAFNNLWDWISGLPSKFLEIGKSILENVWEGMKSIWENISSWISDKFGWISDLISGVKDAFGSIGDKISGILPSHANGLDYVPYDNYVARLHKGERVLTKAENEEYTNGRSGSGGDTFNFYNTQPDPYEYARQMKRAKKELALS